MFEEIFGGIGGFVLGRIFLYSPCTTWALKGLSPLCEALGFFKLCLTFIIFSKDTNSCGACIFGFLGINKFA